MKIKMAAVAALIVCTLCSCGSTRNKTGSLYTPAPITPRPTFDTTRYRTKEEMTSKQDADFVIVDSELTNAYPAVKDEYRPVIIQNNEAEALKADAEAQRMADESARAEREKALAEKALAEKKNNKSGSQQNQTVETTPAPSLSLSDLRDPEAIPDGFSSKNYPYSLYSFDGRTYLGKVTTDPSNLEDLEDSIYNPSGAFGSLDSATSIFNPNSIFGSEDSMFSAMNENASAPPKIIDSQGNFVAYLTRNLRFKDGISDSALAGYVFVNNLI